MLGGPLFRRQFRAASEENAKTQSHLVEVLTGIQTVKAQNVEMVSRWRWQGFYSQYIARTFEKTITGTALNQTSQVLQKISQLMVLWIGASMVLNGDLTLGQLIAFRIISGYVTQPLLRLSTIWQNIQELRVSFERLADVIDTPEESDEVDKSKVMLPPLHGDVRFEKLSFRFRPGQPQVLQEVNLEIPAGTFVAIVGQSGSGKSTLMKLLPRLYAPEEGRILIDDYDIGKVELYSLRRQIGIVPQDPLLFSGSVSDNIALTNPEASSEELVRAARLANAHDFIMDLPSGYSTPVGERGAALSGGQRQRVALARAIVTKPRMLLLDDPLSALDRTLRLEMEIELKRIQRDVGITTIFVTHDQEEALTMSDQIGILNEGQLVQHGSPVDIYENPQSVFVARFLGEANLLKGQADGSSVNLEVGGTVQTRSLPTSPQVICSIRPEKISIHEEQDIPPSNCNQIAGQVNEHIFNGTSLTYLVKCGDQVVRVFVQNLSGELIAPNTRVHLSFRPEDTLVFPDA